METIQVTRHENYAVVKLNRGKANPINRQMVNELTQAFDELAGDDAMRGVILTGGEGIFSAGLDVLELFDYDEAQFEQFWQGFTSLAERMFTFPKPLVAAITGYSPAGGCVFALCCDYRIMAEGKYTIGLNELALGLGLPETIIALLAESTGRDRAYQLVLDGRLLMAAEAREAGVVHEVCPMDQVMERAVRKLKKWFNFDDTTWRKTKSVWRRSLRETFSGDFDTLYGETVRHWWTPECRARVENLIAVLKSKKA